MKNTILKYDHEDIEGIGYVSDYFSRKINISDIWNNISDYIITYIISDNDKLERISYELYGTTDYWDILALLNQRDPLFQMPYEYNTIYANTLTFLNKYIYYIYSNAPLNDIERKDELFAEYLADAEEKNEKYRYIYIVKTSRMGDFIKLIKTEGYI